MVLRIDGERLWRDHLAMAAIGATAKGGVCRLAASREDGEARDLFARWCAGAGMTVEIDRIGNMFARRRGCDDTLAPIMIGSHLDSQPTGGRFDGTFGVLSGLEIVRTLNERGIETDCPIEIVNWTNEEGCRFQPSSLGAQVFAGMLPLDEGLAREDVDGRRLGDELARIGYLGDAPVTGRRARAYLEGHIEQGPVLEQTGCQIGIVEGAMGVNAYEVTLTGVEIHTGACPVDLRHDALLGAARIVVAVNELARRYEPYGRATVAQLRITPNVRSVVAGEVVLTSDCRHIDAGTHAQMTDELNAIFRAEAARGGLGLSTRLYWSAPACRFDPACVDALTAGADELGLAHRTMVSGAGHDAIPAALVCPAAMLFVPSKDGLSHNEAEYTAPEDLEAGANVLLAAALRLAGARS